MSKRTNSRRKNNAFRLIGAHCSIAGGVAEGARRGAALGCNTIQIFTKNNNQWDAPPLLEDEISDFINACADGGIKLPFAHASYLINLASPQDANLIRSVRSMFIELERAEQLELPFVVVHPGSHKGAGLETGFDTIASSIEELVKRTPMWRVKIALETTAGQGNSIGHKFEHFTEIFKRLSKASQKRVVVCLDTAHIFAAGYDINSKQGYKRTFEEFEKYVGFDLLVAIHLNDSAKEVASRVDRHAGLGDGLIGLEFFERILNDPRFTHLPFVIETPKGDSTANDKKNLELIKKLIRK